MVVALVAGWRVWIADENAAAAPPAGLRVTFLDVGQGDGTLLQVPEGAILVDEGPPEADVAEQLDELGVRRLAALVLTHPERDHVGGAAAVLDAHARSISSSIPASRTRARRNPLRSGPPRAHDVPVVTARAGQTLPPRRRSCSASSGRTARPVGRRPERARDRSRRHLREHRRSPDRRRRVDRDRPARPAGRGDPQGRAPRLRRPGAAGVPARGRPRASPSSRSGEDNTYGHPTPETLAALAAAPGLTVLRTDENGRVVVESDGRRLTVRSERGP